MALIFVDAIGGYHSLLPPASEKHTYILYRSIVNKVLWLMC